MKKNRISSEEAFDLYYENIWKERWSTLKECLMKESEKISLSDRLTKPYYMDRASVLVTTLMPGGDGIRFLDMCASPGGKTLSLLLSIPGISQLVANDRSKDRVRRLRETIATLPEEIREKVRVTNHDASRWCLYEKEAYDRILLDAPCSSERHVLNDMKYLSMWSENRPKRLKKEQYALLSSALIALRKGGYILYSTCSINPAENEEVVERLIDRHSDEVEEVKITLAEGEERKRGIIILPDRADGSGPMYCALLRKNNA